MDDLAGTPLGGVYSDINVEASRGGGVLQYLYLA